MGIAAIGGFLIRYLPDAFKWIGGKVAGHIEAKQEVKAIQAQKELERVKAQGQAQVARIDQETAEAIEGIHAEMEGIRAAVKDKASAREYGTKAAQALFHVLKVGEDFELSKTVLAAGWWLVLCIDAFSAIVQPLIATTVFGMWVYSKIKAADVSFTAHDEAMLEVVLGYYLAGRLRKHQGQE